MGWAKIPKNKTDVKIKIILQLLAMRKMDERSKYKLDQHLFIGILQNIWGSGADSAAIHHNDRAQIFAIIMSKEEHRPIYERLSLGVTSHTDLDDGAMSIQHTYNLIVLAFNNKEVICELPPEAYDIPNIKCIDVNDSTRIRITRDYMYVLM